MSTVIGLGTVFLIAGILALVECRNHVQSTLQAKKELGYMPASIIAAGILGFFGSILALIGTFTLISGIIILIQT